MKPSAMQATAVELIVGLMRARPELRKESKKESISSLGCMLQGLKGEHLALIPYDAMLKYFQSVGLSEDDLAAFESLLSHTPIFERNADLKAKSAALPVMQKVLGSRGGARNPSKPKLQIRRTTKEYLEAYCHPAELYRWANVPISADTEKSIAGDLAKECQQIGRDLYLTNDERGVVTNAQRLKLMGYPDARSWKGQPRPWDVRSALPPSLSPP